MLGVDWSLCGMECVVTKFDDGWGWGGGEWA